LGGLGGLSGLGGRDNGARDDWHDSDWDDVEDEGMGGDFGGEMGGDGEPFIIGLINSVAKLFTALPDIKGLVSLVMDKGANMALKFITNLPGIMRRMRPEVKQFLKDIKEPVKDIEKHLLSMKKKMFPRRWSNKLVDLDLMERSVSFCPRFNMSMVRSRTRLSWDLFESRLLDQCVQLGCESKYDLCCPYLLDGHSDQVKATCVYSRRKHYGSCPGGYKSVLIDQAMVIASLKNASAKPTCNRDSDCQVTERCCMKTGETTEESLATCMPSVQK